MNFAAPSNILTITPTEPFNILFTERVRKLIECSNYKYKITVCIGITTVYQDHDAEKIMSIADRALYKAKDNKNKFKLLTD